MDKPRTVKQMIYGERFVGPPFAASVLVVALGLTKLVRVEGHLRRILPPDSNGRVHGRTVRVQPSSAWV